MLPKKERVPRSLFPNLIKRGKSFLAPHLSLKYSPNKTESGSRFSFVVSKAVSKKAVLRNFLKRRGYDAVKKHKKEIKTAGVFVFFFKQSGGRLSFREIENEILFLLKKSGAL